MKTLRVDKNIFNHMITISELGRGKASAVLNKIKKDGTPWYITKNSKAEAVILKLDEYSKLLEAKENLELLMQSQFRLNGKTEANYTSHEDVMKEFGITEEDLEGIEVEFE